MTPAARAGWLAELRLRAVARRVARDRQKRGRERPIRRVGRVIWLAYYHFEKDNAWVLAGHIAYMGLFAIFPFLIFLLALAGAMGQGDAARESVELALSLLPPDVANAIFPAINEVRNAPHAGLMTVSGLVTIWTSSSGIETLRHALNLAYDVADPPSFWRSRLESILLTILAAGTLIAATVLLVVLPLSLDVAAWFLAQPLHYEQFNDGLRYLAGTGILLLLLMALYRVLPNVRLRPLEIVPGALVAWGLWVGVQEAYSLYLRSVPSYSITYGSLGGIVVTLFFFYISALLFIFGAEINSVLKRWRDNREAGRRRAGPEKPAG
jgi:membrane protein